MTNPFAIFDLPVAFNVDQSLLSERYLVLQKSLHPDNFVTQMHKNNALQCKNQQKLMMH